MKKSAKILEFNVKKIKTLRGLRAAHFAFLQDLHSGAMTVAESRRVQKELNALLKQFMQRLTDATPSAIKLLIG